MAKDINIALINATILIEQTNSEGRRFFGTGWLVNLKEAGLNKTALVTARHVFDEMKGDEIKLNWRRQDETGKWLLEPRNLRIRKRNGQMLWRNHEKFDIGVILINPHHGAKNSAIPFSWLANEALLSDFAIAPADELLALGYPRGLSANKIGFPILRAGRVASYPILPIKDFPTFLMDFAVFTGNSGGPVYISDSLRKPNGKGQIDEAHLVLGLLAQQVELADTRLEIGIVIHAHYIREVLLELCAEKSRIA